MLIIIAMLIGGILVAQDMIYTGRLRRMGSDFNQVNVAMTVFRNKYNCIAGDCSNAESFFGTNSAGCPAGGGTTGTCNGNGDGIINPWHSNGNVESLYAWQQLSLAGLIPWTITGSTVTGGTSPYPTMSIGNNVPASSWNSNIGYLIFSLNGGGIYNIPASFLNGAPALQIGARCGGGSGDFLWGTGLTAVDAYNLDTKFDDGLAGSGIIQATDQATAVSVGTKQNPYTTCLSGASYSTSISTGCVLYYQLK